MSGEQRPPLPISSSTLERAFSRTAAAIEGMTRALQENTATLSQTVSQLGRLADAQQTTHLATALCSERVDNLIKLEGVARDALTDIRRALTDQGLKLTETAAAAKRAADDTGEFIQLWTPHGGHRLATPEEAGIEDQRKLEGWVGRVVLGFGRAVRDHWPKLLGAGALGATIRHLIGLLHG